MPPHPYSLYLNKISAMLKDENILEPLFEDSRLPELLKEANARWKTEQQLREEFYEKIQPGNKWEFINGKIIMHSPAKEQHTEARKKLSMMLQIYASLHDSGKVHDETALIALTRNDYLPDIVFFSKEKTTTFKPNTWKYPAPDFVVEVISNSTKSTDKGIKKKDYAVHGIKEYWLVDPANKTVEQYLLNEKKGKFELFSKKTINDQIACQIIQDCSFPVAAIFDENIKMKVVKEWMSK